MHYNMPLDPTYSSSKRERGKVRGNKRLPRTSGPHSECVSHYGRDEQGNLINPSLFKAAKSRTQRTRRSMATHSTRAQNDAALMASMGSQAQYD